MEAIALFFTKFSDEILGAQLTALFFSLSLAVYWMLIRKKKRESAEWVPAALVRAYLDRVRYDERDIRIKLFGEDHGAVMAPTMSQFTQGVAQAPQQIIVNGGDPALARELEALRAQLLSADQRSLEFDRMMNALKAEKAALEQKLKDAPKAAPGAAPAAGANPEALAAVQKEVDDLKAKLQEYEVIEDDLANLKKFQKENEQLKQKVEQYEKGGAAPLTVVPGGKTADDTQTKISGVTEKITTPVTLVSGGATPIGGATKTVVSGAAEAPAQASGESNTNVLQAITPTFDSGTPAPSANAVSMETPKAATPAAAPLAVETPAAAAAAAPAAAGDKSAKQKEEGLLSEFEKMLAS